MEAHDQAYALACAEYKEYFAKHFGEVNTAGDLWVGDFNPDPQKDKLAALEQYLTQLRKWTKHLTRATVLREEFTRTWINEEDHKHKYWREQMRLATNYANALLNAWTATRDEWLDQAVAEYKEPIIPDLVDLDPLAVNPEPIRARKGRLTRPKPSRAELARRVALSKMSQQQRDADDLRVIRAERQEHKQNNQALVDRVCGPVVYKLEIIMAVIESMLVNHISNPLIRNYTAQFVRHICDSTSEFRNKLASWFIGLWSKFIIQYEGVPPELIIECVQPIAVTFYRINPDHAAMFVYLMGPLYRETYLFKLAISDAMAFIDITNVIAPPETKDALLRAYVCSWYIMSIQVMEQACRDPESAIETMANKRFTGDDPRNLKPIARLLGCKIVMPPESILQLWRDMRARYKNALRKR
jgi:hypothetical protein